MIVKPKDLRKKPRWLQKWYANLRGYFWLPCPLCGEYFGGHEWRTGDYLFYSDRNASGVCPNCGEKAKQLSKEYQ